MNTQKFTRGISDGFRNMNFKIPKDQMAFISSNPQDQSTQAYEYLKQRQNIWQQCHVTLYMLWLVDALINLCTKLKMLTFTHSKDAEVIPKNWAHFLSKFWGFGDKWGSNQAVYWTWMRFINVAYRQFFIFIWLVRQMYRQHSWELQYFSLMQVC